MLLGDNSGTLRASNLYDTRMMVEVGWTWDNWRVWAMKADEILGLEFAIRNYGWRI